MIRRSCRRFPKQRLTREEALKGVLQRLAALHTVQLAETRCIGVRNDFGPGVGIIQRKYLGIHHPREARGLRRAIKGHHDHSRQ